MDDEARAGLSRLLTSGRIAHLATLRAGAPMASMTLYLPEARFAAFYVHVSRLAWHTQDMLQDPRVALSIAETDDGRADPFTLMRVSIRGDASQLARDNPALKARWLERFPEQAINFELADFSFWQITPRDARFIAGFGRIHNLSASDLEQVA
ncbi:MAG TPA: pyridoxamine 5'-phosphate oxidase family protein [Burkholderiales bacterium]|jgi:putative heme iron utilization protein|nr:pyridoxamine 5'-phosphate oxidase family protein [Burkholderiales bacterium]